MSDVGDYLLTRAREFVNKHALQIASQTYEMVVSSLGDKTGMLGWLFTHQKDNI